MTEIVIDKRALYTSPPPVTSVELAGHNSSGTIVAWDGKKVYRSVTSIDAVLMGLVTGCLSTGVVAQITQGAAISDDAFIVSTLVSSFAIGIYSKKNRKSIIRKTYKEAFAQDISKPLLKALIQLQKTLWGEEPVYVMRSHLGLKDAPILTGEKYARGFIVDGSGITIMWEQPDSVIAWDSALMDTVTAYELEDGQAKSRQDELKASDNAFQRALSSLIDGEISAEEYLEIVHHSNIVLAKYKM